MSDQLINPTHEIPGRSVGKLAGLPRGILDFTVVVVAFVVGGALSGLLWKTLWHTPQGVAFEKKWYLQPEGLPHQFTATGIYVVVAVSAGILLAGVMALVVERNELVTLAGALSGSFLAAWLMYVVGHHLGPEDPRILAQGASDYAPLPSDLRIAGHGPTFTIDSVHLHLPASPFLAFPLGAVVGLALIYFLFGRRGSNAPRPQASDFYGTGR